MAREVTIANAKAKSDHVKIGQHGADGPGHPCPFWHAGAIKPSPHAQGSGRAPKRAGYERRTGRAANGRHDTEGFKQKSERSCGDFPVVCAVAPARLCLCYRAETAVRCIWLAV